MTATATETTATSTLGGTITVSFPFEESDDLEVFNITTGTVMTVMTHYTVAGGTGQTGGGFATGSVTLVNPAVGYTVGDIIRVRRITDLDQQTDLTAHASLPAKNLETALDKLLMQIQDVKRGIESPPFKALSGATTLDSTHSTVLCTGTFTVTLTHIYTREYILR